MGETCVYFFVSQKGAAALISQHRFSSTPFFSSCHKFLVLPCFFLLLLLLPHLEHPLLRFLLPLPWILLHPARWLRLRLLLAFQLAPVSILFPLAWAW